MLVAVLALIHTASIVTAQAASNTSTPAPAAAPAAGAAAAGNAPAGIISSQDAVDASAPIDVELIFSGKRPQLLTGKKGQGIA